MKSTEKLSSGQDKNKKILPAWGSHIYSVPTRQDADVVREEKPLAGGNHGGYCFIESIITSHNNK